MSWIEVADTAIKIGLGALIAGVFGWLGGRAARKHELYRDVLSRRQETLEKIVEEFEISHLNLIRLGIELKNHKEFSNQPQLLEECRKRIADLFPKVRESINSLLRVEGRLLLAGLPKGTETLSKYRRELLIFLATTRDGSNEQDEVLLGKLLSLHDLRLEFYGWITNDYCGKSGDKFPKDYLPEQIQRK
jgi:hypothetical protein